MVVFTVWNRAVRVQFPVFLWGYSVMVAPTVWNRIDWVQFPISLRTFSIENVSIYTYIITFIMSNIALLPRSQTDSHTFVLCLTYYTI